MRPGPDGGLEDPWRRDPHSDSASTGRVRCQSAPPRRSAPAEAVAQAVWLSRRGRTRCDSDPDCNVWISSPARLGVSPGCRLAVGVQRGGRRPHHLGHPAAGAVAAAARLADDAGLPLLLDVRPGAVIMDSGKDQRGRGHGPEVDFTELAGRRRRPLAGSGQQWTGRYPVPSSSSSTRPTSRRSRVPVGRTRLRGRPVAGVSDIIDPRRLNPCSASSSSTRREVPSPAARPYQCPARGAGRPGRRRLAGTSRRAAAARRGGGPLGIADPEGNRADDVTGSEGTR